MKSHIKIEDYDGAELVTVESRLREQGYRLVRKRSENDLLPGEYIRQEFSTPIDPFGVPTKGTLRWRLS
jgi:hypothetical protein